MIRWIVVDDLMMIEVGCRLWDRIIWEMMINV